MRVLVLGSAAGGGYPQWNCRCPRCQGLREGQLQAQARTQSSIAISVDGKQWLLVNASPDLRQQILANPALWPAQGVRHTPIGGVLITDAQVDHTTGLLMLREGCPMDLYCTPSVHQDLTESFPLLRVLEHWRGGFRHQALPETGLEVEPEPFQVPFLPGLALYAVPLDSNAPPFSPRRNAPRPGDNIGLYVEDQRTGSGLFYAPGLGKISALVRAFMARAACVMVDGTCWRNDEMALVGLGEKQARDMGHLPLTGVGGMLEELARIPDKRRILIHINNTNPILDEQSTERGQLSDLGIEVAFDGMEVTL